MIVHNCNVRPAMCPPSGICERLRTKSHQEFEFRFRPIIRQNVRVLAFHRGQLELDRSLLWLLGPRRFYEKRKWPLSDRK